MEFQVIFAAQPDVGKMVEEIAEHGVTVGGVFHRIENVVMPKHIDIEQRRDLLMRELLYQIQKTAIVEFDLVCVCARPPFAGFLVHQFYLDCVQVERLNRREVMCKVHFVVLR